MPGRAFNPDQRVALTIVFLCMFSTLLFSEGAITGSDGRSMYEVASSLVEHGTLTVDSALGVQGRGGNYYSRYGPGLSLVAAIGYLVVRPIAQHSPAPDLVGQAGAASMMPLVYGFLAAALYLLARRLGATPRSSVLGSLGAVAGTYLLPYSKEFFSEPLTALCLTVSIEREIAGAHGLAAVAAGAAGLTRPQALAIVPMLVWDVWRKAGWRGLGKVIVPLGSATCLLGLYNFARFGNPLEFGYQGYGFTTSLPDGTIGLLFHPAKSLFLFAPISLVLPFALAELWRQDRHAFWLIGWNFLVVFLTAATWVSWAGGWAWGPRLLMMGLTPAFATIALWCDKARLHERIAVVLFSLGAVVSLPTLVVSTRAQQLDVPPPAVGPSAVRQYQLVVPTSTHTFHHLFEYQKSTNREYLNLWQVGAARVLGLRGLLLAAGLSVVLAGAAAVSGIRLRQQVSAFSASGDTW